MADKFEQAIRKKLMLLREKMLIGTPPGKKKKGLRF